MLISKPGPFLRERTTLRLGGQARAEAVVEREGDLAELAQVLADMDARPLILGRGSNILALDEDLPCVLVSMDFSAGPLIVEDRGAELVVQVGSGHTLPGFLHWCAKNGCSGLEGLAGIPGSVGGAVAMNAGSYGCETADKLVGVKAFTPEHGLSLLCKSDWQAGYRHFAPCPQGRAVPDWFIIVGGRFLLQRGEPARIRQMMEENLRKKAATQPITAHSAGCVFKNPAIGVSAGKLLDEAGFKGLRRGGMMFSELHANFLVNTGNGNSEEAMALLSEARRAVYERTGHELQWEVKVYPHDIH